MAQYSNINFNAQYTCCPYCYQGQKFLYKMQEIITNSYSSERMFKCLQCLRTYSETRLEAYWDSVLKPQPVQVNNSPLPNWNPNPQLTLQDLENMYQQLKTAGMFKNIPISIFERTDPNLTQEQKEQLALINNKLERLGNPMVYCRVQGSLKKELANPVFNPTGLVNKAIPYKDRFHIYRLHFSLQTRKDKWEEIQNILTFIKGLVPASDRTYDSATKTWEISAGYFAPVETILKNMNNVRIDYTEEVTASTNPRSNAAEEQVQVTEEFASSFYTEPEAVSTTSTISAESVLKQLVAIFGFDIVSLSEINLKRAYRKKALELHPDRNNGDGTRMSEFNMLWSVYNTK